MWIKVRVLSSKESLWWENSDGDVKQPWEKCDGKKNMKSRAGFRAISRVRQAGPR